MALWREGNPVFERAGNARGFCLHSKEVAYQAFGVHSFLILNCRPEGTPLTRAVEIPKWVADYKEVEYIPPVVNNSPLGGHFTRDPHQNGVLDTRLTNLPNGDHLEMWDLPQRGTFKNFV